MQPQTCFRRPAFVLAVLALGLCLQAPLSAKPLRLRNEPISTPDKSPKLMVFSSGAQPATTNGLFLIQFESVVQPEWRDAMAALGVELLSYVPDDAFVARLENASPARLRQLPFVRWVSRYEPRQKMHSHLAGLAKRAMVGNNDFTAVAVLVAPGTAAGELAALRGRFAAGVRESDLKTGTVLRGRVSQTQLTRLTESEAVLWIEPAPQMRMFDEVATKIVAGDNGVSGTLATVHQLGFTGTGVTVAVADSGLDSGDTNSMHPDVAGRVKALFAYGTLTNAADEHSHGTHCAGIIAGNGATGETDANGALYGLGVAPGASLIAQRIFDGVGNYMLTEPFAKLTHDAKSAGADIGSNSWGDDTQGRYDLSAMEFDSLVRDADTNATGDQPYILEFSAGNAGPGEQTIGSPAVAKNVIATGASQNDRPDLLLYADGPDTMADFSSRGPCEDGRIKPDLVAPGTWIASLRSIFADDNNAWGEISPNYMYQGGTSQAGPHASGAAAVLVQYWRQTHTNATPSPALVKAALINSATDMDETAVYSPLTGDGESTTSSAGTANPVPNMDEGWGRIYLPNLIGSTLNHDFVDQSVLLATGQQFERRVLIGSSTTPLKITLTYTDVPGSPAAIPALVNDLDLEVIAPNGRVYHGNQFNAGESIPDALAFDAINNVEGVHLSAPTPGEYIVRIRARNVPMDARRDTGAVDQDFALVISGSFAPPGTGIVSFDRRVYTAPAPMTLRLVDYDLAGQATASLLLRSGTEMPGENILLHASGNYGLFTGVVFTATGPALADGKLQVQHGNLIEAVYQDGATQRIYTAHADLLPPVISGLSITNQFGRAEIHWTTDEPADSSVYYGTNAALGETQIQTALTTNHVAIPDGQVSGQTNYFKIICRDEAGNAVTNNNGGALFHYVVPFAPAILLVDGFFGDSVYETPPIANYTTPLNQLGLSYDVWNVQSLGSPSTNVLQSYRAVLWRIAEANSGRPTGLTAAEQTSIRDYVAGGGSFFMASMELLSRLGAGSAFASDVLHVSNFSVDTTVPSVEGVSGDPIGDGLAWENSYADYMIFGIVEYDASDTLTPATGAEGILTDVNTGGYVGLRYPGPGVDSAGRVVFLSFPFDAAPLSDRTIFLQRILRFLAPGLNGEGSVSFDRSAYTIPSQATVEVADSDLAGLGHINISVASDSQVGGLTLTLNETARRGVFSGTVALEAISAAGKLRVAAGDTLRADYIDASLNTTVTAFALVETNPPVVTGVVVDAGYLDATVYWNTDELADSLVEYGESPLFGHSASVQTPVMSHAVTLSQLSAQRTYYYRIITRDRAGNVAVKDNGGTPYTFTTLTPLHPPWSDDLEHGSTNWTVYTVADSERGWELGVPGLLSPPAHSPTNAWGSNLNGDYASSIETYLISPAIELTGGNRVTLKFWQAYDFSMTSDQDIIHGGELLLLTNGAANPLVLDSRTDEQADWNEVTVELTPYTNQIVYLAWHYVLFSLDSQPRVGWLVDDISVTVSNAPFGTILITNNLWQAHFNLSGALTNSGRGKSTVIADAPAGQYSVQFQPVNFYQTPLPQTNTLTAGGTIVFSGNYSFTDTNLNGMADAWEKYYFGNANRTAQSDADGDGLNDLGEFVGGTVPTNAASGLKLHASLLPPGNHVHLWWDSVPDHGYRILRSGNFQTWSPLSGWLHPTSVSNTFDFFTATNPAPCFLRLEAQP